MFLATRGRGFIVLATATEKTEMASAETSAIVPPHGESLRHGLPCRCLSRGRLDLDLDLDLDLGLGLEGETLGDKSPVLVVIPRWCARFRSRSMRREGGVPCR